MAFKMRGPSVLKKADPASVTSRRNEGNKKGARLEKRRGKAASKGKSHKEARLARKVEAADQKHWNTLSSAEKAKRNKANAGNQSASF